MELLVAANMSAKVALIISSILSILVESYSISNGATIITRKKFSNKGKIKKYSHFN